MACTLGGHPPADFILAFWMAHEVPDQKRFFSQVRSLLKPSGRFLIAEPWFHVSQREFQESIQAAESAGLALAGSPKIRLSRTALLSAR